MDIQSIQNPNGAQGRKMVNWLIAGTTDFAGWLKLGMGRDHAPPWQSSPPGSSKTNLVGEAVPKRPNAREDKADPPPKNNLQKRDESFDRSMLRVLSSRTEASETKGSQTEGIAPDQELGIEDQDPALLQMGNAYLPPGASQQPVVQQLTFEVPAITAETPELPDLQIVNLMALNRLFEVQGVRLGSGPLPISEEALSDVGLVGLEVDMATASQPMSQFNLLVDPTPTMMPGAASLDLNQAAAEAEALLESNQNAPAVLTSLLGGKESTAQLGTATASSSVPTQHEQSLGATADLSRQTVLASQAGGQQLSGQNGNQQETAPDSGKAEIQAVTEKPSAAPQQAGQVSQTQESNKARNLSNVAETVREELADRIEQMVKQQRSGSVTMHLEPGDLGSLTLQVKAFGTRVDASILASQDAVRQALERDRSQLVQAIEDKGLSLGSMSVGHQSQSESGAWNQGFAQDLRGDWERLGRLVSHQPRDPVTTLRQNHMNKLSLIQDRLDVRI